MYNESAIQIFLEDIFAEVIAQEAKWGVQKHPTGCGTTEFKALEKLHRDRTDELSDRGMVTWADILLEEVYEALGASTPTTVAAELVQISAVCASMARYIAEHGLDSPE